MLNNCFDGKCLLTRNPCLPHHLYSAVYRRTCQPRARFLKNDSFLLNMQSKKIINDLIKKYNLSERSILNLKNRKILPLPLTPNLAMICGHLIGDGTLRFSSKWAGHLKFFGSKEKLLKISKEYGTLFNKKINLVKRRRPLDKGFMLDFSDTQVVRVLNYLGVPSGAKVLSKFEVPDWILKGSKEIKRAFLQAICDDELGGLLKDKSKTNTWQGLKFKMSKKKELIKDHIIFLNQIRSLLKEFGIETSTVRISYKEEFKRKDKNITLPAYFRISIKKQNRINFFKEIGFIKEYKKQQQLINSIK